MCENVLCLYTFIDIDMHVYVCICENRKGKRLLAFFFLAETSLFTYNKHTDTVISVTRVKKF